MSLVNSLYFPTSLETFESISPYELKNDNNINNIIIDKIKNKVGDKCNSEGFIKKNSIKLIKRSIGKINAAHFTGDIHYNIVYEANICIPITGKKITARVIGKNQAGIFCVANLSCVCDSFIKRILSDLGRCISVCTYIFLFIFA